MRRAELLEGGDRFPDLSAPAADGEREIRLPEDAAGSWAVVLFYRGFW